jgi:L-ribulose-5-phosphate 3-epimerase
MLIEKNKLGVMQGRLSTPVNNMIQAFPIANWEEEFSKARILGLGCIEWIYENSNIDLNPICSDDGINQMHKLSNKYDIKINSLVADNFMDDSLCNKNLDTKADAFKTLKFLIEQSSKANIHMLELPLMGKGSIKNIEKRENFIINIGETLNYAGDHNIKIVFELDLPPVDFNNFIIDLNHPAAGINYDMGNSALFGFNHQEEILTYGKYIDNIHIKDSVFSTGTVPLGTGDTNFIEVFNALSHTDYQGDYIFQSARKDLEENIIKESPMVTIKKYIDFILSL